LSNKTEERCKQKAEALRADLKALIQERAAAQRHFEEVSAGILRIEGAIKAVEELVQDNETNEEGKDDDGE